MSEIKPLSNWPTDILEYFKGIGVPAPAEALLHNFQEWLYTNNVKYFDAWTSVINHRPTIGGVYGKTASAVR